MKRKRWIRIAAIGVAALLVVAVAGYVAIDMAVDRALRQIASITEGSGSQSGDPGTVGGGPAKQTSSDKPGNSGSGSNSNKTDHSEQPSSESNSSTPASGGETAEEADKPASDAADRPESSSGDRGEQSQDLTAYTPDISPDKAETVQDHVTPGEKLTVTSVLLKHFSVGDLQKFAAMAGDGISVEDKKAVRKQFVDKLGEEEYNRLIAIAAKYGLSQGKSHAEVLKEQQKAGGE